MFKIIFAIKKLSNVEIELQEFYTFSGIPGLRPNVWNSEKELDASISH